MKDLENLRTTVARLRAPDGCSWDREQTHSSLLDCLIEECSEVLEAVDNGDHESLREELGDLLLSVFMHAQIADEGGRFNIEDVAAEVNEKLIRRHPHVFGPRAGKMSTGEVLEQWEAIKKEEKRVRGIEEPTVFKNLPPRLPALYYAQETAKRIRKQNLPVGKTFPPKDCIAQVGSDEESIARTLFACVAACDQSGIDPEQVLRTYADRIRREVETKVAPPSK